MTISFPTSLDALTNPSSSDNLDTAGVLHDVQHSDVNDAVEALEAKVGINSSAVTTSHDYKLSGVTGSNKAASTGGTLAQFAATTSAQLLGVLSDATGTGSLVFSTDPSFNQISVSRINRVTIVQPTGGATLTLADGTALNVLSGTVNLSGTHSGNSSGTNTGDQTITLTGDVTGTGTGSFVATIPAATVTLAKMADIATARFIGRTTAGTGVPESLTATQATAMLNAMVGDSGSGGTKGLVPAPIAGDSTKFLRGDGTYQTISGGGDALTSGNLSQFSATTSLQLKGVISDETGSGALVFANTPTLVTPVLGVATATSINKVAVTAPATSSTLTIDDGFTLHATGNVTALSGSHTGASSNTNTGDQTITLTGGVTGTGTGSFAATVITNANLTGPVTSVGNATAIANGAISNAMLANGAVANLSGTNTGDNSANTSSQPVDATLTALAALDSTTGFVTETAADTFLKRSLAVGSAKLTVTNPAGVAGNPTLDFGSVASTDLSDTASIILTTNTKTLTNKRVTKRVSSTASSSTPTPNADTDDAYNVTALAAGATFGAPTGTPTDHQPLIIRIKDNGTARSLAFNAIYRFSSDLAAPSTTVISKTMVLGFLYNLADTKWDNVAQLNNI